jgi:hypothetical protein
MTAAEKTNKAISAEEVRIQRALLELGYFAYQIQFQACSNAPTLTLRARPACKGDEELIRLKA